MKRGAFTLIELLVVIAIIGVLAAMVVLQVASAQVRARNATAKQDINQIGKAIQSWAVVNTDNQGVLAAPPSVESGVILRATTSLFWGPISNSNPTLKINRTAYWDLYFTTPQLQNEAHYPITINQSAGKDYRYDYITGNYEPRTYGSDVNNPISAPVDTAPLCVPGGNCAKHYCLVTNLVETASVPSQRAYAIINGQGTELAAPAVTQWYFADDANPVACD